MAALEALGSGLERRSPGGPAGPLLVAALLFELAACAAEPEALSCADQTSLRRCVGEACEAVPCRGDELCLEAACVAWTSAPLVARFSLTPVAGLPRAVRVEVEAGGFPRAWVESLRFSFGDGASGFGEALTHVYRRGGVYPVDLEVRLRGMRILRASRVATVDVPNDGSPLVLTVNEIPAQLNGSIPYRSDPGTPNNASDDIESPFHLLLPNHGFGIDVTLLPAAGVEVSTDDVSLRASLPMGSTAAGENLADHIVWSGGTADDEVRRGRLWVDAERTFPPGALTLSAEIANLGASATLDVETVALPESQRPLSRPMRWLLRTGLDFFATSGTVTSTGAVVLTTTEGGNGAPDFAEELAAFGAQGSDPVLNGRYLVWVEDALVREIQRFFGNDGVGGVFDDMPLSVEIEGRPGAPSAVEFSPEGTLSLMRVGGVFDGYLGFSWLSAFNAERVDDSTPGLGVASAGILSPLLAAPGITEAFDAVKPGLGAPVGSHPADAVVLSPGFDRYAVDVDPAAALRYDDLSRIARFVGIALANVTAHEMGHAMGLVPNDAPPSGYFGNRADVTFMGPNTNSHHADYPGLNLMQAGGNLLQVLSQALGTIELPSDSSLVDTALALGLENRLGAYERAYLQGRSTYIELKAGPQKVGCP